MDITLIQSLCTQRRLKWSLHSSEKMTERGIMRSDIINCIEHGEIIKEYPDDTPNPSYLIFGQDLQGKILHTVVGYTKETLFIITAYYPDTTIFESDLKTRKKR